MDLLLDLVEGFFLGLMFIDDAVSLLTHVLSKLAAGLHDAHELGLEVLLEHLKQGLSRFIREVVLRL